MLSQCSITQFYYSSHSDVNYWMKQKNSTIQFTFIQPRREHAKTSCDIKKDTFAVYRQHVAMETLEGQSTPIYM